MSGFFSPLFFLPLLKLFYRVLGRFVNAFKQKLKFFRSRQTNYLLTSLLVFFSRYPLADRSSPSEFQRPCVGPARQNGGH
jgi:hypothetical protein